MPVAEQPIAAVAADAVALHFAGYFAGPGQVVAGAGASAPAVVALVGAAAAGVAGAAAGAAGAVAVVAVQQLVVVVLAVAAAVVVVQQPVAVVLAVAAAAEFAAAEVWPGAQLVAAGVVDEEEGRPYSACVGYSEVQIVLHSLAGSHYWVLYRHLAAVAAVASPVAAAVVLASYVAE